MGSREGMIKAAEMSLGLKGRPNYITNEYGDRNGQYFRTAPWCNMAITYWARHSDNFNAVCYGIDYAYTVAHAQKYADKAKWTRDVAGIQRGDIVFFDWNFTNEIMYIDHVGLVTDVVGANIYTIEGNTSDTCARRVRKADTIVGYGRPAYAEVTAPPVPPPPVITPTVRFYFMGPGTTNADNKVVQTALNREFTGVVLDGQWGPQTSAAYTRWQKTLGYPGDGKPGEVSMKALAKKYNFAVDFVARPTGAVVPPVTGEPEHVYTRVTYSGRTVNVRTSKMLTQAAALTGINFTLSQGSYSTGVSASAGTHDGGGVVDINVGSLNNSQRVALVLGLRKVGFAAWLRTPNEGFSYHIHAVAIGDRQMSSAAKKQVVAYFNGRNGLANNASDPVARPYPSWAGAYR